MRLALFVVLLVVSPTDSHFLGSIVKSLSPHKLPTKTHVLGRGHHASHKTHTHHVHKAKPGLHSKKLEQDTPVEQQAEDQVEEAEVEAPKEEEPPVSTTTLMGGLLGFPLGYVSGQSTLASSGEGDPSGTAMAHGLAGAFAGMAVAQEWEKEEKAQAEAEAEDDGKLKVEMESFNPDDIKKGAMAGLLAGAIGTTFSGSSGGSDDNNGQAAGGGGGGATEGPSAMSAKIPILHSVIAGGVAGGAIGAMRGLVEKMASKAEEAKEKAKQKQAEAEAKKHPKAEDEVEVVDENATQVSDQVEPAKNI